MQDFRHWLEQRDPQLHQEMLGGLRRGLRWAGSQLLPTALNTAMVLAAPIHVGAPHQHGDIPSPNKSTGIVQDDTANYLIRRRLAKRQRRQEAEQGVDKSLRSNLAGIARMKNAR